MSFKKKIISVIMMGLYLLLSTYTFGNDTFLCISNSSVSIETSVNGNCGIDTFNAVPNIATPMTYNSSTDNCGLCIDSSLPGVNSNNKIVKYSKKRSMAVNASPVYVSQPYFISLDLKSTASNFKRTAAINRLTLKMLRTTVLIV